MGRLALRLVAAIVALLLGYALAGTIGAMLPVNAAWRAPPRGVTIWVEDNGIHTGLVLPKRAAGIDWTADFPAADLRDPRYAAYDHLAIGWGERGFYLGTPTWGNVRPATVLRAALGSSDTLVHAEHVPRPAAAPDVRAITLRPAEYRRLAATIRAARRAGPALPGYGAYDAFYPGTGRYDARHTCNDWTGRTLSAAGVRVGRWTPFPVGVMRWF